MNLLFTTFWAYPHVGGVSTHMKLIMDALVKLGHKVDVFSSTTVHNIVANHSLDENVISFDIKFKYLNHQFILNYQFQLAMYESVAKQIDYRDWDVICCQDVICASIMRKITDKPIILTVHGYLTYETLSEGIISKNTIEEEYLFDIERRGLLGASAVIAVDSRIHEYLKSKFNYPGEIKIIYNFINPGMFDGIDPNEVRKSIGIPKDSFVIVSPRRLVRKNGVKYAVMAFEKLIRTVPNARLLCLGDGPELVEIQEFIKRKNLESSCFLLGALNHTDVVRVIAASDVILIPSIPSEGVEEATSLAALEGMGAGKAVVASKIGGLKELISDKFNGMLTNPCDPDHIAFVLKELNERRDLLAKLGENARQTVNKFYTDTVAAQKYIDVYRNVTQTS